MALVCAGCGVGGVDFHQVVAAALQAVDLLVRHALGQRGQRGVLAKEVVAVEAPILGGKGLHLAVDRALQSARQGACEVAGKQAVPVAAPHQLDDVPARSGKQAFQLVDDAAVAAHRAIEPLQVAVDHPDQVVQPLARSQGEGAGALGLVHLAVAKHAPHFSACAVEQVAVREVAHEARVVDAADGADAHRARGELPEIGHQPRVRVARQALSTDGGRRQFLAVVHQILLGEPPFQKRPRIHARRAVRLEEHQVAPMLARTQPFAGAEEMVEATLEQIRRTGVAGNVAAQFAISLVGAHHHGERVPANDGPEPLLDGQVTREHALLLHTYRVHIRRIQAGLPTHFALRTCQAREFLQHVAGPLRSLRGDQRQKASRHSAVSSGSVSGSSGTCSMAWGVGAFMAWTLGGYRENVVLIAL